MRPVSSREFGELTLAEIRYTNGQIPRPLDIVQVSLLRPAPNRHQTENHIINPGPWRKVGAVAWSELAKLRQVPASLWINSDRTARGALDCISAEEAASLRSSLFLIESEEFHVVIGHTSSGPQTRRTYRARFKYKGKRYNFSLTDPAVRDIFNMKPEGEYPLSNVYSCVSLTEPYQQDRRCHKLVAAVFPERPLE